MAETAKVTQIQLADPEAELRVLAVLLHSPELINDVFSDLLPEMFSDPLYRTIYGIIHMDSQTRKKGRLSQVAVAKELLRTGQTQDAAGTIAQIMRHWMTDLDLTPAATAMRTAWDRRRIAEGLKRLYPLVATEPEMAKVRESLSRELSSWLSLPETYIHTTAEVLRELYMEYDAAKRGERVLSGPTTGLVALDATIGELENGAMLVLAGRSHSGKSVTALNMAAGIAARHGWVLFNLLEMTEKQAVKRLVQAKARVTPDEYKLAKPADRDRIDVAYGYLNDMRIAWCDRRGMKAAELCAMARREKRQRDIKAWFIDYLQLIPMSGDRNRSTALQVGDIVRTIRDCAGELDIPVVLMSQLNRSVDGRAEKEPRMSDLRDSGNIEEFADYIVFTHRPDKDDESLLQLRAEKNRITGGRGVAECTLREEHQYVMSRSPELRRLETLGGGDMWW